MKESNIYMHFPLIIEIYSAIYIFQSLMSTILRNIQFTSDGQASSSNFLVTMISYHLSRKK